MDENKFWSIVVKSISIAITMVVVSSLFYFSHKNETMLSAIKNGANPIAVYCAFDRSVNHDGALCMGVVNAKP